QADRLVVHLRGEHGVLTERGEDAVEVEQGPVLWVLELLGHQVALHERAPPHRRRVAHVVEVSVRIALEIRGALRIGAGRHLCLPGQQHLAALSHYLYYFRYSRSRKRQGT